MKENCWEIMNCERQFNGTKVDDLGLCPATTESRLNGKNDGKNAGRCCWVVAGTYCGGAEQGTFAMKYHNCSKCDFYGKVRSEESPNFIIAKDLLEFLR